MKVSKNAIGFTVLIGMLLAASVISLRLFMQERNAHDKVDIRSFRYTIGEWKGRDLKITKEEYEILETRNLISREYSNAAKDRIYLFIIYSETNRSVFHPPEVCMMGSGVAITDKVIDKVECEGMAFLTNKLYVQKGDYKELVLYSYKAGNIYTNNFYFQQAYLAASQIFAGNTPGATVRVSMRIKKDENATLQTLKTFLAKTVKIVDSLSKQS